MTRPLEKLAGFLYRRSSLLYGAVLRARVAASGFMTRRECAACVQHSGIPGVRIGLDGLCGECREHSAGFDRNAIAHSAELFFSNAATESRTTDRPGGGPNVLVMLSGGKDSLAALALTARRKEARPLALMLDHGFLPEDVRGQAARFCERLGVELVVRQLDIRSDVARAWRRPGMNPFVCFPCCEAQAREALSICVKGGIRRIVTGLRWLWEDTFLPVTSAAFAYRYFRVPARSAIRILNIIPAGGMTERQELDLLAGHGLKFRHVGGDSTCCELFGLFEAEYRRRFGHYWEGERFLSKEIRAGVITKTEAREKLRAPEIPPEKEAEILRRAGIRT
ncbi:MAG: hypothetical protein HY897_00380 [Deltaproteobacteria bacterium]|nr:hypothetical protein [Deltaproteobacteria bacterium]